MISSIWQDIQSSFRNGNMVLRIIFINVFIFVGIHLVHLGLWFSNGLKPLPLVPHVDELLQLSSYLSDLLYHPWTLITHMFFHLGPTHILFNMLCLYWFGYITGDLLGDRRVLPIYVYSGLLGAAFYLLYANLTLHTGGFAYGASGSVMGIALAAAMTAPDYRMNLLLLGQVAIKYIVLVMLFLDIIALPDMNNVGGHIAHLGGASFGALFVILLRQGIDLAAPFNNAQDWIIGLFSRSKKVSAQKSKDRPRPKVAFKNTEEPTPRKNASEVSQKMVDDILDKIKREGYNSLSVEEKETLFKASK